MQGAAARFNQRKKKHCSACARVLSPARLCSSLQVRMRVGHTGNVVTQLKNFYPCKCTCTAWNSINTVQYFTVAAVQKPLFTTFVSCVQKLPISVASQRTSSLRALHTALSFKTRLINASPVASAASLQVCSNEAKKSHKKRHR